jgi:hypothetical protein
MVHGSWYSFLSGLKQISSPDKGQSSFIREEYVPIVVQPLHKTERHRYPKRGQAVVHNDDRLFPEFQGQDLHSRGIARSITVSVMVQLLRIFSRRHRTAR